ncbi:MAG: 23S rRNA pseudouridine(2604) synthase RluF [Rikenellaceae bacterium]
METRLNKFISDTGYCSRREADKFIESGKVTINKVVATLGDRVGPKDQVRVNGNLLEGDSDPYVYLALNKPVGVTSTTDRSDKTNVVDFVNYPSRIFHIGRLDKDSEGLLLLTNDGDIVNKILRAGNNHEKEYEVWVDKPLDNNFVERMSSGIKILGTTTKRCKVEAEGAKKFRITLTQGLNRQIRRMCEVLGYEVTRLRRVRIMNINLAPLATGQWRELESRELSALFASLKESDGEQAASQGAGAGKRSLKGRPAPQKGLGSRENHPSKGGAKPPVKGGAQRAARNNSKPSRADQRGHQQRRRGR